MKKLLVAIFIIGASFFVFTIVMGVFIAFDSSFMASTDGLLLLQALQTIVIFGVSSLIGIKVIERVNPLVLARMGVLPNLRQTLIVIFFAVVAIPGISLLADMNNSIHLPDALETVMRQMEEANKALIERFLCTDSYMRLGVNVFVIAVLPAVCEELMFRGWLQRRLASYTNIHAAIWITGIIFSAIHFQFYGFIPRMLLGAALGYIFYYTGSLWSSILAHFINNALAVIVAFIGYNQLSSTDWETFGTGSEFPIGIASLAIAFALIYLLNPNRRNRL